MNMSVTGAGSAAAAYNFKSTTNAEFAQQIQSLRSQGALTADQSVLAMLDASGGDSVPINGQPVSTSQALSDTTKRDFLSIFQTQSDWMHSTSGSVGSDKVDSLLQTLQAYQGKTISGSHNVSMEA